jgi:hypothetical protein
MSGEHKKRSGEQGETLVVAPMRLAKRAATAGSWGKGEAMCSGRCPENVFASARMLLGKR